MAEEAGNFYDEDAEAQCEMGHSESKGAKKRDKSVGNGNKPSRGVATSFGFRRRPASTSRADDNARRKNTHDKNGNGGSTEDLRPEEVLSGRSTPLARPRKETATQPLRSNRFGFRHPHSKTARVGDVSFAAEPAFTATSKDKETAINNNAFGKHQGIGSCVPCAGNRHPHCKTARVGDVSFAAEPAFTATSKDKETAINNNAFGKHQGIGSCVPCAGNRHPHCKTARVGDVSFAAEPAFTATSKDKETAINNNALGKNQGMDSCVPCVGNRHPHCKTARVGDVSFAAEPAFTATSKDKETAINNNAFGKNQGMGSCVPCAGNRQPHSKIVRTGDLSFAAEPAFTATSKVKETAINNNALVSILDKKYKDSTNPQFNNQLGLIATQVSGTGTTTIVGSTGLPKAVTKQTVILTYQTQQYSAQDGRPRQSAHARASSASRVPPMDVQKPPGKYTFQTNQLPRPQYPAVKNIDAKAAKQVVNNTRKAVGSDGWREGAGSAVSTDSGVYTGGDGDLSPSSRRRPRNLEMVMRGAHSFHLRELQVTDFDIMDDALITGSAVIPLPKLPSSFDEPPSPEYTTPAPTYRAPSPVLPKPAPVEQSRQSPMSTLDRYRTRTRPNRIQTSVEYKDEEKFVLDRAQPELLNKQNSFIKTSSGVASPATVNSSKESSPSCKSEESHFGNSSAWQNHAAGEAMANRSQDDVSLALSVSSCEDEKSKLDSNKEAYKLEVQIPKKTILIMDENPVPHPLLMKSVTLNQHDSLRSTMMGSMSSSNYSTTSTCTNQSGEQHLTLTLEESKFDMSVLETSTHSLLDDETSPADSLISSTSTSDSNNDLHIEREPTISSSAYQTANTKSRTPEPRDALDGDVLLKPVKEVIEIKSAVVSAEGSKNRTPESPGTPTHASGELSLSDGKDYFDDEIADQPALLFRKDNDGSQSSKTLERDNKQIRRSRERIPASPLVQRNRKMCRATERTASLDTLSSLASDDLMMDNDLAQSITSLQSVDDYIERLDSSLRSGINSLDERQLRQELSSSKTAVRQWSQLLEQSNMLDQQLAAIAHGKMDSMTQSNASLNSLG
ncbi:hypothetical protein O0L34_g4364 [Tuta absoluta]|nr:hypothetical protein O0L34_g4364 [Tuta absoluta]